MPKHNYFVQINDIQFFSCDSMEQPPLFIEENDLHRLQFLRQLSGRNIGVDIKNPTIIRFGQTREYGKSTCSNRGFNGSFIDPCDFSHKAVFFLIQIIGAENPTSNWTSTSSQSLQSGNKF